MRGKVLLVCIMSLCVAFMWMACATDDTSDPVALQGDNANFGKQAKDSGGKTITADILMPSEAYVKTTVDGCENSPGPWITLEGALTFGGLHGRLIFRNNTKGTHEAEEDVYVEVVLLEEGEKIVIPKQPVHGGVGGNPKFFLQLVGKHNKPYCDEIYLGRCVQGLNAKAIPFFLPCVASAHCESDGCKNHPGPWITIDGNLLLGRVDALLILRNNDRGTHETSEEVTVSINIIPDDGVIKLPKQPPLGGTGGNPLIYFQFTTPSGKPLSGEFLLGRCVQL